MIRINLDMSMPEECHECPFQLKFRDDEVDDWCMRRCVITHRKVEYPRPEWCPLEYISKEMPEIIRCKDCKNAEILPWLDNAIICKKHSYTGVRPDEFYCADGERNGDDA